MNPNYNLQQMAAANRGVAAGSATLQQSAQSQQQPQHNSGMRMIVGALQNTQLAQPIPPGWQQKVRIDERAILIHQFHTSLRLVTADLGMREALQAALKMEAKLFYESADKAQYDRESQDQLRQLQVTRFRNMAQQNQGSQNFQMNSMQQMVQGGNTNQNVAQMGQSQLLPPQLQHQIQSSSVNTTQGQQMAMGNAMQGFQGQQQSQRPQQFQPPELARQQHLTAHLTPQETQQIMAEAKKMYESTSKEQLEQLSANLIAHIPAQQKQAMIAKGEQPVQLFFRNRALKLFLGKKIKAMQQSQGLPINNAGEAFTMATPQPRQVPPNMMTPNQRGFAMGGNQGIDAQLMGNSMDQILGQQADGFRSQEAGQLVVPASTGQTIDLRNMTTIPARMDQQEQINVTRPMSTINMTTQQQLFNTQKLKMQSAQAQARSNVNPQVNSDQNGLPPTTSAPHVGPSPVQQSVTMAGLNRSVGPSFQQQQQAQVQSQQQRSQSQMALGQQGQQQLQRSQTPMMPQQQTLRPPLGHPQMSADVAASLRQHLNPMPDENLRDVMRSLNGRTVVAQGRQNLPGELNGLSRSMMSMDQQILQMQQQQALRAQNSQMMNPLNVHGPAGFAMQGAGATDQRAMAMKRLLQRQFELQESARKRNVMPTPLTPDQLQLMDAKPFPPHIINENNAIPPQCRTWNQLKAWARPRADGLVLLSHLESLQRLHFYGILEMIRQGRTSPEEIPEHVLPPDHGLGARYHPQNQLGLQLGQDGIQRPANRTQMNPIFPPQILASLRQRFGNNLTDDQLKAYFFKMQAQRQAVLQNASQSQQFPAQSQAPQAHQLHGRPPRQIMTPGQQQEQFVPPHGHPKNVQQGIKRPNSDEAVEPSNQTQGQQPTFVSQGTPLLGANATPQQRAQVENALLKQPMQRAPSQEQQLVNELNGNFPTGNIADYRKARFKHFCNEAASNTARRPPAQFPVPPEVKALMMRKLAMLSNPPKVSQAIFIFWMLSGDEARTREFLEYFCTLNQQLKDSRVADGFTVSPDELEVIFSKLHSLITFAQAQVVKMRAEHNALQQPQNVPRVTAQPMELNAANLQQQQQALQKEAARANLQKQQASAGRSSMPSIPHPSPDGIPQYVPNRNELTPDKLKFPPAKRRKHNVQGSTAATPRSSTSPNVPTVTSPETRRQPSKAKETNRFKCPVADCAYHKTGFSTHADMERHHTQAHKAPEPTIEDGLAYTLEGLRASLGLNSNGKRKPQVEVKQEKGVANAGKQADLKPGTVTKLKQEATDLAQAVKMASPSPSIPKTPIASATHTPASGVKTSSIAGKTQNSSMDAKTVDKDKNDVKKSPLVDAWVDASLSLSGLHHFVEEIDPRVTGGLQTSPGLSTDTSTNSSPESPSIEAIQRIYREPPDPSDPDYYEVAPQDWMHAELLEFAHARRIAAEGGNVKLKGDAEMVGAELNEEGKPNTDLSSPQWPKWSISDITGNDDPPRLVHFGAEGLVSSAWAEARKADLIRFCI